VRIWLRSMIWRYQRGCRCWKAIYRAPSLEVAESKLLELESRWKAKYPILVRSWLNNWEKLVTYFDFPDVIRKAIYTNNPIESYHRQIRKHTKNKGVFPSDQAVLKLIYLLSRNIMAKWSMRGIPCLYTIGP